MSIDTLLGIIGLALGILSIITGCFFYLRGRKYKELCYTDDEVTLINGYSSIFRDLEIEYKGNAIQNLTISKVTFWNNGTKTIDKGDIETAFPLMIIADKEIKILDVKVLKFSNPANNFSVLLDANGKFALLRFDYLNSRDGAIIQVIHTGVLEVNFVITGEIKGVKEIKYKTKRSSWFSRLGRIIYELWLLSMFVLSSIGVYDQLIVKNEKLGWSFVFLLASTGIIFLVMLFYEIRESKNAARIPKELAVFERTDESFREKSGS